jgi:putative PIN family toxin of toxin-antitoxin system
MKRLRIVLDTLVAFRAVELFVSEAVLAEYREVFSRPKFARLPSAEVAALLALIQSEATMVTPSTRLEVSTHDSDNRFYECADTAQADYIVTATPGTSPSPTKTPGSLPAAGCWSWCRPGRRKNSSRIKVVTMHGFRCTVTVIPRTCARGRSSIGCAFRRGTGTDLLLTN